MLADRERRGQGFLEAGGAEVCRDRACSCGRGRDKAQRRRRHPLRVRGTECRLCTIVGKASSRDSRLADHRSMGIRYVAISIDADDYLHISKGPCPACGTRPHPREPEYDEPDRDVLDLDKSWHYLQRVFRSTGLAAASKIVAGNVTNTRTGWISHQGTIAPDQVGQVALELASVTPDQLRAQFTEHNRWIDDRSESGFEYVAANLAAAVKFTAKVASDTRGVVYYIG